MKLVDKNEEKVKLKNNIPILEVLKNILYKELENILFKAKKKYELEINVYNLIQSITKQKQK